MRNASLKLLQSQDRIPFLQGRPDRSADIDKDDLLNLRIALGLHSDVLDLCEDPHLFDFKAYQLQG